MTRRLLPSISAWLVSLGLVAAACSARADDVALDSFTPAPDQAGFLGFPSTRTPGSLRWDAHAALGYTRHPLSAAAFGTREPGIRDRAEATLAFQLGLGARAALALRLPVLLHQRASGPDDRPALAGAALGNPALDGRVRLWGDKVRPDGSVPDGGGLALRALVQAPVSGTQSFFRDSAARGELSLISDVQLFGIAAGAALGVSHRFAGDGPYDTFRDRLTLQGGLRVPLPLLSRAFPGRVQDSVLVELGAASAFRDFLARRATPVEARLGYRVQVRDAVGTLAVGAGLVDAIGAPDLRALLVLGYAPRARDQDGDGVRDSQDGCPHSPEDRDGFEDGDGCADDDNDQDMVLDDDDRCPLAPAEPGRDEDEDGCTDP
jgi:OmpA-OmpF porin, OOP family